MKNIQFVAAVLAVILIYCSLPNLAIAQRDKCGIVFPMDVKKYAESSTVTWYGWDFSNFKICDKNVTNYLIKVQYIPEWISEMNKIFSINTVRRDLDKPNFFSDLETIQNLYKKIEFHSFITDDIFELPVDSIVAIVKRYQLPQKEGAGFVIIIENINKPQRYVSGYLTFFDIATKNVLWVTKMKGLPGGKWGVEQYYRNGILELYPYFFRKYYSKTIKNGA